MAPRQGREMKKPKKQVDDEIRAAIVRRYSNYIAPIQEAPKLKKTFGGEKGDKPAKLKKFALSPQAYKALVKRRRRKVVQNLTDLPDPVVEKAKAAARRDQATSSDIARIKAAVQKGVLDSAAPMSIQDIDWSST